MIVWLCFLVLTYGIKYNKTCHPEIKKPPELPETTARKYKRSFFYAKNFRELSHHFFYFLSDLCG